MIKIKPHTIVVTGGLGFIGSRFIKYIYENTDHNIINVDKHTYAADHDRIPLNVRQDIERYRFLQSDICDNIIKHDEVRDAEYVVNFAAESHVDNSIENGEPFMKTNVMGYIICWSSLKTLQTYVDSSKYPLMKSTEI